MCKTKLQKDCDQSNWNKNAWIDFYCGSWYDDLINLLKIIIHVVAFWLANDIIICIWNGAHSVYISSVVSFARQFGHSHLSGHCFALVVITIDAIDSKKKSGHAKRLNNFWAVCWRHRSIAFTILILMTTLYN